MIARLLLFLFLLPACVQAQGISERLEALQGELDALLAKQKEVEKEIQGVKMESCRADIQEYVLPKLEDGEVLVEHKAMSLVYSEEHEQAKWVAHVILPDVVNGNVGRTNDFRVDPLVPSGTTVEADYFLKTEKPDGSFEYDGFGYDRGHLAPSADFRWCGEALSESYFYSNMSPQVADFNRGIWAKLENQLRAYVSQHQNSKLFVVTGPVLKPGLPKVERSINGVSIPEQYFKVVIDMHLGRGVGFLLPNKASAEPLLTYATSIDEIEQLTGLDFFHGMPDDVESRLESQNIPHEWVPEGEEGDVKPLHPPSLPRGHYNTIQSKLYMDKNERIHVCGKVVGARYSRKGNALLNLDKQYPNQIFTVFIRKDELINFSYDPVEYWKGKYVRVTEKVIGLGGKPAMFIEHEKDIEPFDPEKK